MERKGDFSSFSAMFLNKESAICLNSKAKYKVIDYVPYVNINLYKTFCAKCIIVINGNKSTCNNSSSKATSKIFPIFARPIDRNSRISEKFIWSEVVILIVITVFPRIQAALE